MDTEGPISSSSPNGKYFVFVTFDEFSYFVLTNVSATTILKLPFKLSFTSGLLNFDLLNVFSPMEDPNI